jgi:mono/diheme cytochrome c family protein
MVGYMMSVKKLSIFTLCLFFGANAALAETLPNEGRGGLLYSTHCSTCHNSTIHWREQKLATDWQSLKAQVNRWQRYTKLRWGEQDIVDVTAYLNTYYYNFISTESKALSQAESFKQD